MVRLHQIVRPSTLALVLAALIVVTASHAQNPEAIQRAQDDIARAESAERQLQKIRPQRAEAWDANADYSKRETAAGSYLAEAKLRLQTGSSTNDFVELTRASALAMRAAQDYEAIVRDLEAWKPPVPESKESPETRPSTDPKEPKIVPEPRKVDKVEPPPSKPEEKPIDATGEKLENLIVLPPTPPAPPSRASVPPPSLWAAADAYFKGGYDTTLDLLAEFSFEDSRAVAQAYLFRSAAGFALYQIDRGADESVLSRAAEDAKHALGEDPDLEVPPLYFSPKYRAFFDQQR